MIVFQKNGNNFEQFLHYNDTVTTLFPVDYYNGNLKRIDWRHGTQGDMNCYEFEYNNLDRLVVARFVARDTVTDEPKTYPDGTPDYRAAFGYDLNANITSLLRMGLTRHLHEGNSQERVYDRIDDYYPYGMPIAEACSPSAEGVQPLKYTSKELHWGYQANGQLSPEATSFRR